MARGPLGEDLLLRRILGSLRIKATRQTFGGGWLVARLAGLLPDFPAVRVLVAFSGGVDSTALLAALARHRPKALRLRAIHVNHGLHPRAAQWSGHCRAVARTLHVPLQVVTTKVPRSAGMSLEEAAREARYKVLARALEPGEFLLTAHHEDDQLETVLLQLFRGSGVRGIAAMPDSAPFARGCLARPLLSRSRKELEEWVRAAGLAWIEDETNSDEQLDRNYLRRRVLPLVRARWKGVATSVSRSARHAAEAQRLLDAIARADVERAAVGADLSVKILRALEPDRRRNALRFWIGRSGFRVPDSRRLEELAGPVINARPDAHPCVAWQGAQVLRHAELLAISPAVDPGRSREPIRWEWHAQPSVVLPGNGGMLELKPDAHGPIALDTLPQVLTIRWRSGGEMLRPRRGGPRRSLKTLLQEARLPIAVRASLPLIFSGERLLAAGALWLDASIQAAGGSPSRGRLHWMPPAQ